MCFKFYHCTLTRKYFIIACQHPFRPIVNNIIIFPLFFLHSTHTKKKCKYFSRGGTVINSAFLYPFEKKWFIHYTIRLCMIKKCKNVPFVFDLKSWDPCLKYHYMCCLVIFTGKTYFYTQFLNDQISSFEIIAKTKVLGYDRIIIMQLWSIKK